MTARRIIRGLEEAVRHSRGEIEATTHRVTVLDYPARHIVIPDGVRAMPSGRATHASHRTALRRFGHTVSVAIARTAEFLGSDRGFTFFLGFFSGSMFTVAMAYVWSFFL